LTIHNITVGRGAPLSAKGRIAGYRIGEDQSGGIGTILQPVFSPMSAMGHFRQIDTLASLAACPL
jgi:hypothetical protein